MTSGSITKLLIMFAVPLVIGNLFQQLYNTVDSLVVGNFVGSHALAAVGSTTSIINMIVMFFTGTSVGAGVVISRYYGAHDDEKLHIAVETTMAVTFICGIIFTGLGIFVAPYMLKFMSTPDDVLPSASVYLDLFFRRFRSACIQHGKCYPACRWRYEAAAVLPLSLQCHEYRP